MNKLSASLGRRSERKVRSKFNIEIKGHTYRVQVVKAKNEFSCEECIFESMHINCSIYKNQTGFCSAGREDKIAVNFKPLNPIETKGGEK